ncbi:MAG: hypothetical protein C9356_15100 [Oleiphilus sp.]|nr:MAG: hypothetical protein C9356_15100 [Oleiphilus sp.]
MSIYSCYLVDHAEILPKIPAVHPVMYCHHITVAYGIPRTSAFPEWVSAKVVGIAVDYQCQALVCEIDGTTERKSGGTFHITVSVKDGVKPVYSNDLIEKGWQPIDAPFAISAIPALVKDGIVSTAELP